MVLLYASRACYNLAALALAPRSRLDAFDYDWYNVSDQVGIGPVCPPGWPGPCQPPLWWQRSSASASPQADLVNDLGNKGYLVVGLILFIWELLPTPLLVGFFRVHRPPQDLVGPPTTSWCRVEGWALGILVWGPGTVMAAEKNIHSNDFFPHTLQSTSRILNGQGFGSRSYFFDRAGHCEDEGCSWEHSRSESTR